MIRSGGGVFCFSGWSTPAARISPPFCHKGTLLTGDEFSREWNGHLATIEFVTPKPLLPAATVSFFYSAGLPRTFSITGSQIVTFTTISTATNVSETWPEQMREWAMPHDWARFWRIGDIAYTQADAWLCIEEVTGCIYAIDVDIDNPVYLVARSVINLAAAMLQWSQWYAATAGAIATVNELRQLFLDNSDIASDEFDGFWGAMLDSECETGIERFTVTHT
jgi:hypothetical protein